MRGPEPMPGYGQLLRRGYGSVAEAVRGCGDCGWELASRTWAENAYLGWGEVLLCGLCALGWTALRRAAARRVFRVSPGAPGERRGLRGGSGRARPPPPGAALHGEARSPSPGAGWVRGGGG